MPERFGFFHQFVEDVCRGVHDLATDRLKIMLTGKEPSVTDAVKSDLPEITAQNGYTAGGKSLSIKKSEQVNGTFKLQADNIAFKARGGSVGPFRYVVLYNDKPNTKPLIAFWSYDESILIRDGEDFRVELSENLSEFLSISEE